MTMTTKNLRIYEAIADADAMAASQRRELSPKQLRESRRIYEGIRARVDEFERHMLDVPSIRPSIRAMTRDAIVARLAELGIAHPTAVIARPGFQDLPERDLRTALEAAECALERMK